MSQESLWFGIKFYPVCGYYGKKCPSQLELDIRKAEAIADARRSSKKLIEVEILEKGVNGSKPKVRLRTLYDPKLPKQESVKQEKNNE